MENIEKPLTWVLAIALLGYLFIANCECEESSCTAKNDLNIEIENKNIELEDQTLKVEN